MTKFLYKSSEDIVEDPRKYEGQWVALPSDSKVPISSGESFLEVREEAKNQEYENPTMFKVPRSDIFYIL